MRRRDAVTRLIGIAAVVLASAQALAKPPAKDGTVLVHGTVRDYRGEIVAGVLVRASVRDKAKPVPNVKTDRFGRFDMRVLPRTHLSVFKDDMFGSIDVGAAAEQTIVIKMAQMPM